jgi:Holliday junction resolvase RusA-like endonuclease
MSISEEELNKMKEKLAGKQTSLPIMSETKIDNKKELVTIDIILRGEPVAKQSVRANPVYKKDGNVQTYFKDGKLKALIRYHQPAKYDRLEKEYRTSILSQLPNDFKMFEKEVHITRLEFIFPALKSFTKKQMEMLNNREIIYHTSRPDVDNCRKLIFDSMTGLIYKDDSKICTENNVIKRYGIKPGILIQLKGI